MSPSPSSPSGDQRPAPVPQGTGEVRTYRGRTVQELIPKIRSELGDNAIILRERQGLTGGLGGFFAQRCVEIDAQAAPRISVYADDDELDDEFEDEEIELDDEEIELDDEAYAAASAPRLLPPAPEPLDPGTPPAPAIPEVIEAAARPAQIPAPPAAPAREPIALGDPEFLDTLLQATGAHQQPIAPPPLDSAALFSALVDDQPPADAADAEDATDDAPAAHTAPAVDDAPAPTATSPVMAMDFIAFDELGEPDPAPAAEPEPEPELEPEVDPEPAGEAEPQAAPEPAAETPLPAEFVSGEPVELTVPVVMELRSGDLTPAAQAPGSAVFRRAGASTPREQEQEQEQEQEPGPEPALAEPAILASADDRGPAPAAGGPVVVLTRHLVSRGFSPPFAEALMAGAVAQAGDDGEIGAALRAILIERLPTPPALPLAGGAVAIAGPGGSGKTRVVAAMAAAYARAGHPVTVARLGTAERSNELAELLHDESVDVIPSMRTRATARAAGQARGTSLVLIDTPSTSIGDSAAAEVLSETLAPFALDAVLLTVPATYTAATAQRLIHGFAALSPAGLVATHVDEADHLATVAEAAISQRVALGYLHAGLDIATAISSLDPARLVGHLLR